MRVSPTVMAPRISAAVRDRFVAGHADAARDGPLRRAVSGVEAGVGSSVGHGLVHLEVCRPTTRPRDASSAQSRWQVPLAMPDLQPDRHDGPLPIDRCAATSQVKHRFHTATVTSRNLTVAKPDLGTKRLCASCGAKFYDLGKNPIVCPKCDTVFVVPVGDRRARGPPSLRRSPSPRRRRVEVEPETADAEFVSLEDADAEADRQEEGRRPASAEDEEVEADDRWTTPPSSRSRTKAIRTSPTSSAKQPKRKRKPERRRTTTAATGRIRELGP